MPPKSYLSLVFKWCKLKNFILFILPVLTISCSHINSSPAGSLDEERRDPAISNKPKTETVGGVKEFAQGGTRLNIGNYNFRVSIGNAYENYTLDTGEKREGYTADLFDVSSGEKIVAKNSCKFSWEPIDSAILAPGCRIQAGDSSILILRIEAPVVIRAEGKEKLVKSYGTVYFQTIPDTDSKN